MRDMIISTNDIDGNIKKFFKRLKRDPYELICICEEGKPQYIVLTAKQYDVLRALELKAALLEYVGDNK